MDTIYIDFTFLLANGSTRIVTVKDLREDVTDSEVLALADMFISKSSQYNGSNFSSLKKCQKYTVNVKDII